MKKRGFRKMAGNVLHPKTIYTEGVLAKDCAQLLTDFFARKRELSNFVKIKRICIQKKYVLLCEQT